VLLKHNHDWDWECDYRLYENSDKV
jgi:hypothetical protein